MDLFITDTNFQTIYILDSYNSLIWTDRFNECGDFEIYTRMNIELLDYLKQDYYIRRNDSDHVMIIEKILIESDIEDGDKLTVSGRSLESLLDRRIVWGQKTVSGNLQNAIKTILNENIISPSKPERKINNFIFENSTDPNITSLTIEAQYLGDNIYDIITSICEERSIGFKITLNENNQFVFKLYSGIDRSYDQTENPYVVFSPSFDNLISSNYLESKSFWKNVTLVGGAGEGTARKYTAVGNVSGLERREMFTDASSVSTEKEDGTTYSDAEYLAQIRQRGNEDLIENYITVSFEGEAETQLMFKYGSDFFNGDIVQVLDAYGHDVKARVYEIVTSEDESGFSVYPTFSMIQENNTLPEGYVRLEYIQSTGTQYINTNIYPTTSTEVYLNCETLQDQFIENSFFGCSWSNNGFLLAGYNSAFRWHSGGTYVDIAVTNLIDRFDILCSYNRIKVNGVQYSINPTSSNDNTQICLLYASDLKGYPNAKKGLLKIYSCQIYDNGIIVRDYIPCKSIEGVVGIYDTVNQVFYTNSGTGSFIAGPSA